MVSEANKQARKRLLRMTALKKVTFLAGRGLEVDDSTSEYYFNEVLQWVNDVKNPYLMDIYSDEGVLWDPNRSKNTPHHDHYMIGTMESDRIANLFGFMYAEHIVIHLAKEEN